MSSTALMELNEVHRTYRAGSRSVSALQGVSLRIHAGERVGLVGESGSGKSTLARLMLGMESPDAGSVLLNGQSLSAFSRTALARQIQLVFQDPYGSLNPRLTIGSALEETLAMHNLALRPERASRVAHLLEQVGLSPDAALRYPHEFSGGQRQRIALARALAVDPRILIADEPVSALDVSVQVQILNLLSELQRQRGLALLLIAHDLAVVRYTCERVYVMHQGCVVEEGPVALVLENPQHPYTERLLEAVPDLDAALATTEPNP